MGEPENLHFHGFGIFGRVPEPQNQLFLSLETPGHPGKMPKSSLLNIVFVNLKMLEIRSFVNAGKDRRPTVPTSRLIKS